MTRGSKPLKPKRPKAKKRRTTVRIGGTSQSSFATGSMKEIMEQAKRPKPADPDTAESDAPDDRD